MKQKTIKFSTPFYNTPFYQWLKEGRNEGSTPSAAKLCTTTSFAASMPSRVWAAFKQKLGAGPNKIEIVRKSNDFQKYCSWEALDGCNILL